jgi:hypothetical protein
VAILSDLGLVLTLQILRNATQTAFAFKLPPLGQAHIFCSLIATLLYFWMVYLGIRLLRTAPGPNPAKALHRKLGLATLLFRTLGFLLMFSLLKSH